MITVKQFCYEADFTENFTNHSGKFTCAASLFRSGVDGQLIMQQTGHRSDAVRAYKKPSWPQDVELSSILQPTAQKKPLPVRRDVACMGSKPPEVVHSSPSFHVLAPICPSELTEGMDSPTSAGKVLFSFYLAKDLCQHLLQLYVAKQL